MASNNRHMKILITLRGDQVATRFDMCGEVLIGEAVNGELSGEPRTMLLSGPSADEICSIAIKENITTIITGGMEDEHYQYLLWKKIKLIDRVIGDAAAALSLALAGGLQDSMIIPDSGGLVEK